MKLGTVAYIPPAGKLFSEAFVANITRFPAKHPLYTLSDDAGNNPSRLIKNPELVGKRPAWSLNNLLFLKALELARDTDLTHYLYLESDSRVGCEHWDERVFSEYWTRYPAGIACAGSPVIWDLNAGGREFAMRVINLAHDYQKASGLPMAFYSSKNPLECSGAAFYCNGSCAIYETAAMLKVFAPFQLDIVAFSRSLTAYDISLGRFLWNYHGPAAIDHVGFLTSLYSGFGDCTLNSDERKARLLSGRIAAVHQIKDDWLP